MMKLKSLLKLTLCGIQQIMGFNFLKRLGWANVFVVAVIGSTIGCSGMPTLEEQERLVRANELVLHRLTPPRLSGLGGSRRISILSLCSSSA